MSYVFEPSVSPKLYRRIWRENYPDANRILGKVLFVLRDTYGVSQRDIAMFLADLADKASSGYNVIIKNPYYGMGAPRG